MAYDTTINIPSAGLTYNINLPDSPLYFYGIAIAPHQSGVLRPYYDMEVRYNRAQDGARRSLRILSPEACGIVGSKLSVAVGDGGTGQYILRVFEHGDNMDAMDFSSVPMFGGGVDPNVQGESNADAGSAPGEDQLYGGSLLLQRDVDAALVEANGTMAFAAGDTLQAWACYNPNEPNTWHRRPQMDLPLPSGVTRASFYVPWDGLYHPGITVYNERMTWIPSAGTPGAVQVILRRRFRMR